MKTTRQEKQIEWFRVTRLLKKLEEELEGHRVRRKTLEEIECYLGDRKKELQ